MYLGPTAKSTRIRRERQPETSRNPSDLVTDVPAKRPKFTHTPKPNVVTHARQGYNRTVLGSLQTPPVRPAHQSLSLRLRRPKHSPHAHTGLLLRTRSNSSSDTCSCRKQGVGIAGAAGRKQIRGQKETKKKTERRQQHTHTHRGNARCRAFGHACLLSRPLARTGGKRGRKPTDLPPKPHHRGRRLRRLCGRQVKE